MIETAQLDDIERKRQAQFYTQMETLIENSAVRFARPAEAILAAEGRRASQAYIAGGRSAAIAEPDAAVWLDYLTRLWIVNGPAGGEMTHDWLTGQDAETPELGAALASSSALHIGEIGPVKAAAIADTSRQIISEAIDADEPVKMSEPALTASRILKTVTARRTGRATAISRTETHESVNYGALYAAEYNRAYDKLWLATPDNRVRDAHMGAHSQRRKLRDVFIVGGDRMMYPGDTSLGAAAANTVNCRCVLGFIKR